MSSGSEVSAAELGEPVGRGLPEQMKSQFVVDCLTPCTPQEN